MNKQKVSNPKKKNLVIQNLVGIVSSLSSINQSIKRIVSPLVVFLTAEFRFFQSLDWNVFSIRPDPSANVFALDRIQALVYKCTVLYSTVRMPHADIILADRLSDQILLPLFIHDLTMRQVPLTTSHSHIHHDSPPHLNGVSQSVMSE